MIYSHRYLVSYDIEKDRERSRVARLLEKVGWRVQFSVFECLLDEDALDRLAAALSRHVEPSQRSDIRIYRLCANCHQASFGLGRIVHGLGADPWVVV